MKTFVERVGEWLVACFGRDVAMDQRERQHRFMEEALELVQAGGMPKADAYALVDYVYNRPAGSVPQEFGGVSVTLAAMAYAMRVDLRTAARIEMERIEQPDVMQRIREKQATKPHGSPLPVADVGEMVTTLERAENEVRANLDVMVPQEFVVRAREGGGLENVFMSLALSLSKWYDHHVARTEALQDMVDNGLRFDLNPTHNMSSLDTAEEFWHAYARRMDKALRERARKALSDDRKRIPVATVEQHFATTADVHAQARDAAPLSEAAEEMAIVAMGGAPAAELLDFDIPNGAQWQANTFTDRGHAVKAGACKAIFRDGFWFCDRCSLKWKHDGENKPPCDEVP